MVTPPSRAADAVPNSPPPIEGEERPAVRESAADLEGATDAGFAVELEVFSGPFDLLLSLISKHRLDITEVALARVTDDFIAFVTERDWPLEESSEFLVIAATLLDLKAARLLPAGEVEDPEDLARLEARDLLFARLLQYRAYRSMAEQFQTRLQNLHGWYPRGVELEDWVAKLLPELIWAVEPDALAQIAAGVLSRQPAPTQVDFSHLHAPKVSVREEAANLVSALRHRRTASFRQLTADAPGVHVVVARFLALLELFRENQIAFEQVTPLGDLHVRWTGSESGEVQVRPDAELEGDEA